ncbi:N-formyl-4-amino-5-aminomethyl-2-methylpyrimidine deformylase [subsurface metagenome]
MKEQVPEKEAILKYVTEENVVELAKDMIRIPSLEEEESELARFLEKYMKDKGLETEMIEVEEGRIQPIGRIKGTGGGYSLIFNGHMDVDVIYLGLKDPYVPRIEGRRLYGHGSFNMKGGVAAMIEAAVAIKKSGVKLKGELIVTPVVGELQGGTGTAINIKRGIRADFGLVPEPYGEFFCLTHAGSQQVAITIRGRSEQIRRMEYGINLSAKIARTIDAINNMKLTYTPDPRLPGLPRMIIGSGVFGHGETYDLAGAFFLPDICTIIIQVVELSGMHPDEDIRKVLEKIKAQDPEFNYEMRVTPDDPELPGMPWRNKRLTFPFQDLSPDELIVKVHAQNYKYLTGEEPQVGAIPVDDPRHSMSYAADDDAHLTKAGIPSFCCGPVGEREPTGEQFVDIDSMVRVAKNFALTAYDICTRAKE